MHITIEGIAGSGKTKLINEVLKPYFEGQQKTVEVVEEGADSSTIEAYKSGKFDVLIVEQMAPSGSTEAASAPQADTAATTATAPAQAGDAQAQAVAGNGNGEE